jgi:glycosyltransferase involved in cell wall biosynthesis
MIRFSIVIPTLNRKDMLLLAIDSVRRQDWPAVQMIVVDGGSRDGSLDELEKCADVLLLRGPDHGVYDAFNKGVACADGDVVGILNSDDLYEPGAFAAVARAFAEFPDAQAVCGNAVVFDHDRIVTEFKREGDKIISSPRTTLIGSCAPNARFFRRDAMAQIGPFSLQYRYVSDRDWLTRWFESGLKTVAIPDRVYRYRQHGGSLTFRAQRPNELAIRAELLALARQWRDDPSASPQTRRVAVLLEGRCLGVLALAALSQRLRGRPAHHRLVDTQRRILAPVAAVCLGAVDWCVQALRRASRPKA